MTSSALTPEHRRLQETQTKQANWKKWGPYLSERQWGTVREDYSPEGEAWDYFPHDHARSRAYRWGEDGILGICDDQQRLCFALAMWNGNDAILKERFFGLTGNEGNHGEDVKEYYFYLDSTPTHSYMKALYKYPQAAYPYQQLQKENRERDRTDAEYELLDTGVFEGDRYFDVQVEYAKATDEDTLIHISITNRGPETADFHLLPTLWFRNTWSWGEGLPKPTIKRHDTSNDTVTVLESEHPELGKYWLYAQTSVAVASTQQASSGEWIGLQGNSPEGPPEDSPENIGNTPKNSTTGHTSALFFTENETNKERLFDVESQSPYVKDAFDQYLIQGDKSAINPAQTGTKSAIYYHLTIAAGQTQHVRLRLAKTPSLTSPLSQPFQKTLQTRQQEADKFYHQLSPLIDDADMRNVQRQAFAGMMWGKQYYLYDVNTWLKGDPNTINPPTERQQGRNKHWHHLDSQDILSMPDTWEYPWFAAWDTAFHCIPLALIDAEFAKQQLDVMTREWYMHPNGQLPAYEWAFGDVNPPVHAWATWRVYKIEKKMTGKGDRLFLERLFQKLLLNFTWWVNRKDTEGNNVFEGGFLGLDNIGVFDRSKPLPTGGRLEQADGTSWMAMYCLDMLVISLELALENPVYEDMATKFFEHFIYISEAMNASGENATQLWDEEDGFFYDVLHLPDTTRIPIKIRSLVGLMPLYATTTLEPELMDQLPGFLERLEWFEANRPKLSQNIITTEVPAPDGSLKKRRMLTVVKPDKLRRILAKMLKPHEFLGATGIRALSRFHEENPYTFDVNGKIYRVDYEPAESSLPLFGGNSNWRGPIWFPTNYLLIESLQRYHRFFGDTFKIQCPYGFGEEMNLWAVATKLEERMISTFVRDKDTGRRPVYGGNETFQNDPHWRDHILFYEYFNGNTGAGLGASHQTGWTGLVAKLIHQCCEYNTEADDA
ncbi:MAG: glucosidase [Cyanobacteria bacterium P01_F01_bin.53]